MLFNDIYLEQLLQDFTLVEELGPLIGVLLKLFTIIFIDAPIMMFVLTMAGITRFTYLKFFNAMPLMKGVGLGMFGVFLVNEGRACSSLD